MRAFVWFLRLVLFVVLLGFAVKNSSVVTVRFFFDTVWQVPLVMVMFVFFVVGAAFGLTAVLATLMRQRRELLRLQRASQAKERVAARPDPLLDQ